MNAFRDAIKAAVIKLDGPQGGVLARLGGLLAAPSDEGDKAPGWLEKVAEQELANVTSAIRAIMAAAGGAMERGASAGYLVDILEGVRQDPPQAPAGGQPPLSEPGQEPEANANEAPPPGSSARARPPARA